MMYMHEDPIMVLILTISFRVYLDKCTESLPEVDETKDQSRDNGKVGEVKAHGRSSSDGEGNVISGTDGTVERNCSGDDEITNGTEQSASHDTCNNRYSLHGTGSLSPTETKRDLKRQPDRCRSVLKW
jgi:hypothetical protein